MSELSLKFPLSATTDVKYLKDHLGFRVFRRKNTSAKSLYNSSMHDYSKTRQSIASSFSFFFQATPSEFFSHVISLARVEFFRMHCLTCA